MLKDSHLMVMNFNMTLDSYKDKLLVKECSPSEKLVSQAKVDFYSRYLFNKDIKNALLWANSISKAEVRSLFTHYTDLYWTKVLQNQKSESILKTITLFKTSIPQKEYDRFYKQINTFEKLISLSKMSKKVVFIVPKPFDENLFNTNLEGFLQKISQLADKIQSEISVLPATASIVILDHLTQLYAQKAQELRSAPLIGLEKNYKSSITQVLKQLSNALLKKYRYLARSKNKAIRGQKINDIANLVINNYDISLTPLTQKTVMYLGYDKLKRGGKQ